MDCWLVLLSNVVKRGLELATAAALGPEPELLEACDDEEEKDIGQGLQEFPDATN